MGLVVRKIWTSYKIADRERSPMYEVGVVTNDHRFTFQSKTTGLKPGLRFGRLFRSSQNHMNDKTIARIIVIQNIIKKKSQLFRASLQAGL
jgi:phosphoribosylformylglycinamidine synthase